MNPLFRIPVPPPRMSPVEKVRQIASYGALLHLHKIQSVLSGKPQLSRYNPALYTRGITVDEFWSDAVDNTAWGQPYDFHRSFFDQWRDLLYRSYLLPLVAVNVDNCDYVNGGRDIKNCYLSFATAYSQDCLYCWTNYHGNDDVLCVVCRNCQFCYACCDLESCYGCQNCTDCTNCSHCIACVGCIGCQDCIGCYDLRNVRYCVYNEQLTRQQFEAFGLESRLSSGTGRENVLRTAADLRQKSGFVPNRIINCEDSSGAYLRNSRNMLQSYNSTDCEDCSYLIFGSKSKDCWYGYEAICEFNYMGANYETKNSHFSYGLFNCDSCSYSFVCARSCSNCFGCVGLKRKQYCILNHQYTKQEYEDLLPRVTAHMKSLGEWGEWFPPAFSPHFLDETWINDFLAERPPGETVKGYRENGVVLKPAPPVAISAADLPDDINDVDMPALRSQVMSCAKSGQGFNYQRRELEYYRRFQIPLPVTHWRVRLEELIRSRERMC